MFASGGLADNQGLQTSIDIQGISETTKLVVSPTKTNYLASFKIADTVNLGGPWKFSINGADTRQLTEL